MKEVERSHFFREIPRIVRRFWFPMGFSAVVIAGMAVCAVCSGGGTGGAVPVGWRVVVAEWAVILPMSYV